MFFALSFCFVLFSLAGFLLLCVCVIFCVCFVCLYFCQLSSISFYASQVNKIWKQTYTITCLQNLQTPTQMHSAGRKKIGPEIA